MPDWNEIDWADIVPRVELYATRRFKRMKWHGEVGGSAPGGKEPADFVMDAIRKTVVGKRHWNPEKASLFRHLAGVVRSDMGHLARSPANRTTVRATIKRDEDDNEGNIWSENVVDINRLESAEICQEKQMISQEGIENLLDFLEQNNDKDRILRRAAEFIMDNHDASADEIAEDLGISRIDAYNLKKRLRRATNLFLSEARSQAHKDGTNE